MILLLVCFELGIWGAIEQLSLEVVWEMSPVAQP